MPEKPKTFRLVDDLPPGSTALCWDGRVLLILPLDWTPPQPVEMRAVPVIGRVR